MDPTSSSAASGSIPGNEVLNGGQSGPAAIPGKPDESLLIKAVRQQGPKMPLGGKLSAPGCGCAGGMGPERPSLAGSERRNPGGRRRPVFYQKLIREYWAFQPVRATRPPRSAGNPIDAFVRAKLEQSGLKPASAAQPRDLIRRLANVLTGLPPEEAEVQRLLDGYSIQQPTKRMSTICSRRRTLEKNGRATGWMWFATPKPTATNGTTKFAVRGAIATI